MTPTNQKLLRLIDRVTVKGSIEPIDFYTLDIYPNVFKSELEEAISRQGDLDKAIVNKMEKKKQKMFAHKTR